MENYPRMMTKSMVNRVISSESSIALLIWMSPLGCFFQYTVFNRLSMYSNYDLKYYALTLSQPAFHSTTYRILRIHKLLSIPALHVHLGKIAKATRSWNKPCLAP